MDSFLTTTGLFLTGTVLPVAIKILIAVLIYWLGTKLMKWVIGITDKALNKAKVDAGVHSFILSALRIALYVVLAFVIVSYLGIATTGIAALFASAGVTVGLALQGSLSNLAGGVLILVLKPFKIGDYIVACGIEGTVTDIEIFYTKLSTGDNKKIVVPNGALANSNITNVSHQEFRRVDMVFSVAYNSDVKQVKDILAEVAAKNELVLKTEDRSVNIYINEFAASSIDFGLRVWTRSENYWSVKWQTMEDVKAAFDAAGIEIPFNQLDVNLNK